MRYAIIYDIYIYEEKQQQMWRYMWRQLDSLVLLLLEFRFSTSFGSFRDWRYGRILQISLK